jgi:hypothetical protein
MVLITMIITEKEGHEKNGKKTNPPGKNYKRRLFKTIIDNDQRGGLDHRYFEKIRLVVPEIKSRLYKSITE